MKNIFVFLSLFILSVEVMAFSSEDAVENSINTINKFIYILQNNDYKTSAQMVVPMMHRSLLGRYQKKLDNDIYSFSFKKAHLKAKKYSYPVKVTRVQKLKTTEIGFGSTYDQGIEYKIWIDKKAGALGMPASIVLFFKEGSKDAKLSYVGSL